MSNLEDQLERQLDALKKDWSWAAILAFTGNLPDLFAGMRKLRQHVQELEAGSQVILTEAEHAAQETQIEAEQRRAQTR